MKISLHHTYTILHPTVAAFIRGDSPLAWMKEISRWNIDIQKLSCYILPQSIQSPLPAGLFVKFKDTSAIPSQVLLDPYGVIAGKLFLPVHSSIYPACTPAELEKILMWEVQVFHPTIGLVGFEKKDAVSPEAFFDFILPSGMPWNYAHKGVSRWPSLQQIEVLPPTPADIIDAIRKELEAKPIQEIPGAKESKTTVAGKLADAIKYGLFKSLYKITNQSGKVPQLNASPENGKKEPLSPTLMDQWRDWLVKNIHTLEEKRQDEIQRLLKLFADDNDDALQYAIPLDSPYLDRGKAPPSFSLTRRSTTFNLRNLGGGGAVDGWDIGDRYHDLRAKYIASAQKQIEKGDFKKAAYIYAHLLGDFYSAANVLVQGKYFREAATLYKDHLNNAKAAAECLENGGLLTEAIEMYKQLDNAEKIGDLYKTMDQHEQAGVYFEKSVERYLTTSNFLEASRVLHEKKQESDRAKQLLLEGWSSTNQPENCLKRYFDFVAVTEKERMEQYVEKLFKEAPVSRQSQFLNVLLHVKQHYANEKLEARSVDIAYQIISNKAGTNDYTLLSKLNHFITGDKLLASDVSRYTHSRANQPKAQQNRGLLQLDKSVKWIDATWYHSQVIVVGTKDNKLHLARCNWYNNVEYYSWANDCNEGEEFTILSNPYYTNRIIIKGSSDFHVQQMLLPKNKYFNHELIVDDPGWLPERHAGMMFNQNGGITLLDAANNTPLLHYYSVDGKLEQSITCKPVKKEAISFYNDISSESLHYHDNYYYTDTGRFIVSINTQGEYSFFDANSGIRMYAVSTLSPTLKLVVSTNAGCILLRSANHEFIPGEVFAAGLIPSLLEFISADRFVIAEKNKMSIFEISDDRVALVRAVNMQSEPMAIIPSARDRFGIIDGTGDISLHEI